jgi:hypothetical protein
MTGCQLQLPSEGEKLRSLGTKRRRIANGINPVATAIEFVNIKGLQEVQGESEKRRESW